LQIPGQVPGVTEQFVGHFKVGVGPPVGVAVGVGPPVGVGEGVGVAVGPPTTGASGIVTSITGGAGRGVGANNGVAAWSGFGSCSFCTVYVSPGAQNENALEEAGFGGVFCTGVFVIITSSLDSTTEVPRSAFRTVPVILP
jgi:hypothetical protein